MPLGYDPEYAEAAAPIIAAAAAAPKPAVHDVDTRRTGFHAVLGQMFQQLPDAPGVTRTEHKIQSKDGQTVTVHRFFKKDAAAKPGPAILHAHSGGKILADVEMFSKPLSLQVQETGVQLFSVDYRWAPENPHPKTFEDCYAGLIWLYDHADEFGVDKSRIAVMGESAGGNLAAAMAIKARDEKLSPPLAKQILIYPMLDDRNIVPNPALEPFATWDCDANITAWAAQLGKDNFGEGKDVSPDAAPARVKSVEGLPTTYIDVGELDIFRDEDIAYAGRLAAANISVEFHVYPGVPHVFEIFAPFIDVSRKAMANRYKAISAL